MNILLLHRLPISGQALAGVADVELAFPTYDPENLYLTHNARLPFPNWLKSFPFDAIFVTSTFLDLLWSSSGLRILSRDYDFLAKSKAVKVAFPQDDYWCSETRDSWYVDNAFDLVYPVCQEDTWDKLVHGFIEYGGTVKQGYTTYITPRLREQSVHKRQQVERQFDVVYRAKGRPAFPNNLGVLKANIGEKFLNTTQQFALNVDITTSDSRTIRGENWFDFLRNARATIVTPSGSSLRVRDIAIASSLNKVTGVGEPFTEEMWASCGVREDDLTVAYTALSPRILEAAATGTVQLMVGDAAGNFLKPARDFINLNEDCGNAFAIVETLGRFSTLKTIADSCWLRLSNSRDLAIENHIANTIDFVQSRASSGERVDPDQFISTISRHSDDMQRALKSARLIEAGRKFLRHKTPDSLVRSIRSLYSRH